MGNLPSDRIKMGNKLFSNVGFDYCGPIIVKLSKQARSNVAKTKRWGVIFSCLSTCTVNSELAGELTTNSFLL